MTATEQGGANDARFEDEATITVSKDDASGQVTLSLGHSQVTGLTYVVETARGIQKYAAGTAQGEEQYKTLTPDDLGSGALEIPRGLTGHIWVVPTFTNAQMYADASGDYYKTYGVTNGVRVSSETPTDSNNPMGTISLDDTDGYTSAYAVKTNSGDLKINENEPVSIKITTDGDTVIANGISFTVNGAAKTTAIPVKISAPVVVSVAPELYDGTTQTYTPLPYDADQQAYLLAGNVGQQLKLRVKVTYSDGTAVDALGGNLNGVYQNGVYFTKPTDTFDSYDFSAGPTLPAETVTGFANGTGEELSVLYGYLMSAYPSAYNGAVNPVSGAPEWNYNLDAEQIQSVLSKLSRQLELHAYQGTGEALTNQGIVADWLFKDDNLVPGHYGIALKQAGKYLLDFSGTLSGASFDGLCTEVTDLNHEGQPIAIQLTVSDPVAEAVYLVGVSNNDEGSNSAGCLNYMTASGEYRFDNTPVEGGAYKTFKVYPVILDTTWWALHPDATALPAPSEVTEASVGANNGIRYVTKADWSSFVDVWTNTADSKLVTREKTDAKGYLYLEVTVLDGVTAAEISLQLKNPVQQSAEPEYRYTVTPQPADPAALKVSTTSADQVVDITITAPAPAVEVTLGDTVSFDVEYLLQKAGENRELKPEEFPGEAGYTAGAANALVVTPAASNPAGCTFAKGTTGSKLVFTPSTVGTYTFTLTTKNDSGAPIPTAPTTRQIVFTVKPAALTSQTIYYGETTPIPLPSGAAEISEVRGQYLDAALLATGSLKMVNNAEASATVQIKNADGELIATLAVACKACEETVSLVPNATIEAPAVFADGETQSVQWKTSYTKPGLAAITMVKYEPVTEMSYVGGTSDFLTISNGKATAHLPAQVPGILVLTGIYRATNDRGERSTYVAKLNTEAPPPAPSCTYELRDNTGNPLTGLTLAAPGQSESIYLYDVTDSGNPFLVSDFNVSSNPADLVTVANVNGMAQITARASGSAVVTFQAVQATSIGQVTLTVEVGNPPPADLLTITQQPANRSVSEGATATFTVAATADAGAALRYQWQQQEGAEWVDMAGKDRRSADHQQYNHSHERKQIPLRGLRRHNNPDHQ